MDVNKADEYSPSPEEQVCIDKAYKEWREREDAPLVVVIGKKQNLWQKLKGKLQSTPN